MMAQRGGSRPNAGRPKGSNKYKEETKPMRIPISRIEAIQSFLDKSIEYQIPLYHSKVQAGFPSPADDYIESYLDLNQYLIKHPAATFFVRASGDSMINAGIASGDLLIVDRSLKPTDGSIVIAAVNGELTVKRLSLKKDSFQLLPENERYAPIVITEALDVVIWGVVLHTIHSTFKSCLP